MKNTPLETPPTALFMLVLCMSVLVLVLMYVAVLSLWVNTLSADSVFIVFCVLVLLGAFLYLALCPAMFVHGILNLMTLGQYPAFSTKDYCTVLGRLFCITLIPIGIAIVSTKMYNHPGMPYIMPPDLLASIHTHLIVSFAVPFLICSAALAAIYITALLCNQSPRELVP